MTPHVVERLTVAVRAYRAAEPTEAEVQAAVRRARLSLRRPPKRRARFLKLAVLGVLAMGGLAYANPSALHNWVSRELADASVTRVSPPAGARAAKDHVPQNARPASELLRGEPRRNSGSHTAPPANSGQQNAATLPPDQTEDASARRSEASKPEYPLPVTPAAGEPGAQRPVRAPSTAPPAAARPTGSAAAFATGRPVLAHEGEFEPSTPARAANEPVSDWGRVGNALARGDEQDALQALASLADSPDERTRDKADLGRAQLYMANGDRDRACALARSLTRRRAGGRIERQAQLLLRECQR
jgi:hypothetical protein